ncbi:MAG: RtcB family protein, partial [Myxococcota bacterium]
GIAIGSVVASEDLLVPQAVGTDINCGMRLHTVGVTLDRFLAHRDAIVARLTGDYLLGTRDIVLGAPSVRAMFDGGLPDWVDAVRRDPRGTLARTDLAAIAGENHRVYAAGALPGDARWAPETLVTGDQPKRDDGLATIGRGNHFVEVQVVDAIVDRHLAFDHGLRRGELALMVHSGSRKVGKVVGSAWAARAREAWPAGVRHPPSGIWPLSWTADPALCAAYLAAEATAANYAFVNRALLAELFRVRLREVLGDVDAPLVADVPHNLTFLEDGRYVARKGACPAHDGQLVLIPGSMGAPSFVAVGRGDRRFLQSASHGAGRAVRRQEMRGDRGPLGLDGVDCVTLRDERRVEEAPAAYKPVQDVIDAQVAAGTIAVVAVLRPVLTFKA